MPGSVAIATRARPRIPARRKRDRTALTLAQLSDRGRQTNNFDLLRLLAAGLVLFAHSFDLLGLPEPGSGGAELGDARGHHLLLHQRVLGQS